MMSKIRITSLSRITPIAFYAGAMVIFGSKIFISDATSIVGRLILGNQESGLHIIQ